MTPSVKERLIAGLKSGYQLSIGDWSEQLDATTGYISVLLCEIRKEKDIFPRTGIHPESGKKVIIITNDDRPRSARSANNHVLMIDGAHERVSKDAFTRLSNFLDEAEKCVELFPQLIETEAPRLIQLAEMTLNRDYEKYRQLAGSGEASQLLEAGS